MFIVTHLQSLIDLAVHRSSVAWEVGHGPHTAKHRPASIDRRVLELGVIDGDD